MLSTAMREEAVRQLLGRARDAGRARDLVRPARRTAARTTSASSGWSPSGPNTRGKKSRLELADHHVGSRSPSAARRAGSRPGPGLAPADSGPDAEARAVEADRSSRRRPPRCGCHHRRAHAHAGDLGLERALVRAGVVRDVGRGAAHVEADDRARSRPARAVRTAPTMPPAGPDRIASLPWNRRASVSPPFDCMNISRTSPAARRRPGRRSGAGSATGRRRPRWCRRGRPASSAG